MAREQKKKDKPKRQVVLIIIEGQSEENALSVALSELFEAKYGEDTIVLFAKRLNDDGTKGGDITSLRGAVPGKIEMLLNYTTVMPCISENNLMPKYVTEIIHIIDTDGAFIPDDVVTYHACEDGIRHHIYEKTGIRTDDVVGMIERNHRKSQNILSLLGYHATGFPIINYCDTGHGKKATTKPIVVPYTVYYFSCNLDHFTTNDPNLDPYLKILRADEFGREYGNDLESFKKFIMHDDGRSKEDYLESWNYIQKGLNSLQRHTNINLIF